MIDKSWMLNPQAIRHAKYCIEIVKNELGIKLKLSHPEFLRMLHEYAELNDSVHLQEAFDKLIKMAGPGFVYDEDAASSQKSNVHTLPSQRTAGNVALGIEEDSDESIEFHGKVFPKWRDGKSFKGVYRGQPSYG